MLLMASEGLGLSHLAKNCLESPVLQFLAYQTDHVAWVGCSLWDLIQPSFSFIVGVAVLFHRQPSCEGRQFLEIIHPRVVEITPVSFVRGFSAQHSSLTNLLDV